MNQGKLKVVKQEMTRVNIDILGISELKWITNKDLLYSTGNSVQCYVAAWMGGEFGRE